MSSTQVSGDNPPQPQMGTVTVLPKLPEDPEAQLRGYQALYQNPFYLSLLAKLAVEEQQATADVFSNTDTNVHFKYVGLTLGLVRIKQLHLGEIEDLKLQTNDSYGKRERERSADPGSTE